MLTAKDAILIALNGSAEFAQKLASADQDIRPDRVLNSHLVIADRLEKYADVIQVQQPDNISVPMLREAAEKVKMGLPVKAAMYVAAGGSVPIANKLAGAADIIGEELLAECIQATYQKKVAEFIQKKKTVNLQHPL
jgi:hypothetical protein